LKLITKKNFNKEPMKKISQSLKIFTLLVFSLVYIYSATGQVKNEEVTVIAAYEPSLSDAHKININPEIDVKEIDKPDLKYNFTPRLFNTQYEPVKITPAKLSGEPLTKLYQSYIRAGFGNYTTPYAELFYNKLRSRSTNLGINYKHYSSAGKIKDYAPAGFSDNILNAYGSYYAGSHIIGGDFLYKRQAFHYYGFKPADFNIENNDSLKNATFQKYQLLEGTAYVKSDYNDKDKIQHNAQFKFYNLKNNSTDENALLFDAGLSKNIDLINKIDDEKLKLDVGVNYYNNRDFIVSKDAAVYILQPQISFLMNQYALNVGLNTNIEAGDVSFIHFFPIIEGQIAIAKDVLSLYGSFTGNIERNNIRALYEENPFVQAKFDTLDFTKNKILFKGGVKGNIASALSFNIGAGYRESNKLPFFVSDTSGVSNQFCVIYDDVSLVHVFGDFLLQTSDKFMLMFRGEFNHYTMGQEIQAWHKPLLKATLLAQYTLVEKINIKAEIYGQDKTYTKVFNSDSNIFEAQDIDAFADFNIGLEYLYNKKISAFLNLNNVTGVRYQQWYNYPLHRFHILAGLSYAF